MYFLSLKDFNSFNPKIKNRFKLLMIKDITAIEVHIVLFYEYYVSSENEILLF